MVVVLGSPPSVGKIIILMGKLDPVVPLFKNFKTPDSAVFSQKEVEE